MNMNDGGKGGGEAAQGRLEYYLFSPTASKAPHPPPPPLDTNKQKNESIVWKKLKASVTL